MKTLRTWRLAACVFGIVGAAAAQEKDPNTRAVEDKGVFFKLPANWQWATESDLISIRQLVKLKDAEHEITGELVFETKKFADAQKKDIQKKVEDSKGTLKDLKFSKTKLGAQKCHLASFVRVRGEGPTQTLFEERVFFFKRGDGCFTWTEKNPKVVSSQASGAFDSARKAFTFKNTAETTIADVREFREAGARYKLPEDFEWGDRAEAKRGEKGEKSEGPAVIVLTEVDVKDSSFLCEFRLWLDPIEKGFKNDINNIYAQQSKADPAKVFKQGLSDVSDVKIEKKGEIAGERCVTWSWVAAFEKNGPKKIFNMMTFVKKNHTIQWMEIVPWSKTKAPEVEEALKAARGGLTF